MKNKIIIGGYSGSGTRVISMILEQAGYNIGKDVYTKTLDYMPILKKIDNCWYNKKCNLKIKEEKPYAIKHGQSMLVIPEIKRDNPGSKFILVIRHGVDNILNGFEWENTYYKDAFKGKDKLLQKISAWTESYKKALKDTDHVVKLEEICFNSDKTIQELFDFLNIKKDPKEFISLIRMPMSIGRRHELQEDTKMILFNIGKEVLNKFNYVI